MLIANLYTINSNEVQNTIQKVSITLNPECDVFKGHFPNFPVTPGVALLQIIKNLLETHLNTSLFLQASSSTKFLSLVNPNEQNTLSIHIHYTILNDLVKAKIDTSFQMSQKRAAVGRLSKNIPKRNTASP